MVQISLAQTNQSHQTKLMLKASTSTKFTGSYHFQKRDTLVIIVGENTVYGGENILTWKDEFVSLWEEYRRECYADSTLKIFNKDITWQGLDYRGQIKKWIHKQPTFTGFMDFIKSRGGIR
jgi:hypothetical protein